MSNDKIVEKSIVINIAEIFHIIIRRLWIIVIVTAMFAGLGGLYATTKESFPMYRTTTKLYVTGVETATPSSAGFNLGQQVINNYIQILRSRPVLEEVIEKLSLNMNYWDLLSCISERNPIGTCMLEISIIFPDPQWAKLVADEIVVSSSAYALEIMGANPPIVYEEASIPTQAFNGTSINFKKYIVFGGFGGACISLFIILVLYFTNSRLTTPDRIEEKLHLKTLAIIPKYNSKDAYRVFYSNLKFKARDAKVLAFISSVPQENKSEIMKEWIKYMGRIGKKVIYVDADLYNIHSKNSVKAEISKKGLKEYLEDAAELQEIIFHEEADKFDLIYSGEVCENSCELLGSDKFTKLLQQLKLKYDYIVLDAPLAGKTVDAFVIAKNADETILQISATKSRISQVKEVKAQMDNEEIKILGVVLRDISLVKTGRYFMKKYARYFC